MRIGSTLILLAGLLIIPRLEAQVTPSEAWEQDFQLISKQIALRKPNDPKHQAYNKMIESQAFRQDAMILDSDRDAASVILRRTEALLEHLQKMQRIDKNKLQPLMVRFKALTAASIQIPVDHRPERKALYVKACRLRREIAFTNPLLDFNRIVFIKRHRARYQHGRSVFRIQRDPRWGRVHPA